MPDLCIAYSKRDVGEVLERCWRGAGEMLERYWRDVGEVRRDVGEVLERCWRGAAEMLERCWGDVEELLESCWTGAGETSQLTPQIFFVANERLQNCAAFLEHISILCFFNKAILFPLNILYCLYLGKLNYLKKHENLSKWIRIMWTTLYIHIYIYIYIYDWNGKGSISGCLHSFLFFKGQAFY